MTTNWKKRGQALCDGKPNLKVKSSAKGPNHIGHPVPKGYRGTELRDRNPMHDQEPIAQEEGRKDPIRSQLVQRGVR
jgi:hypothetical protein